MSEKKQKTDSINDGVYPNKKDQTPQNNSYLKLLENLGGEIQPDLADGLRNNNFEWSSEIIHDYLKIYDRNFELDINSGFYSNSVFDYTEDYYEDGQPRPCSLWQNFNCNLNVKDKNGETALMKACRDDPKLARKLMTHPDVQPNQTIPNKTPGQEGVIALMIAAQYNPELAQEMAKYSRVNLDEKDSYGYKASDYAEQFHPEIADDLKNEVSKERKNGKIAGVVHAVKQKVYGEGKIKKPNSP